VPIYEFECPRCKRHIELELKINDVLKPLCFEDSCDGVEMYKILSKSTFILSGDGWSKDGYSRKK
jgi:putative FmdB family regulatory protein